MADHTYERLLLSIAIPGAVARAIYLTVEAPAQAWLQTLKNVPSWAFEKDLISVAWWTTYICSGLAAFIVLNATLGKGMSKNPALVAYAAQLLLCWTYTAVVYGFQSLDLGLAVILLADVVSLLATVIFFNVSIAATILNAPTVLWLLTVTGLVLRCRQSVGDKVDLLD